MTSTRLPLGGEQFADRALNATQTRSDRIAQAVNDRGPRPNVIRDIACTGATEVAINHGLGRVPSEWDVIDVTGNFSTFYRVSWNDKTLTLMAGNTCTIAIRVA